MDDKNVSKSECLKQVNNVKQEQVLGQFFINAHKYSKKYLLYARTGL